MKTEGTVRQKLKQVRFRYLKDDIAKAIKVVPDNCKHNIVVPNPDGMDIHICGLNRNKEDWVPTLCDYRVGNRAANCSFYQNEVDKETVKSEFTNFISTKSLPEIAAVYPDMAALMWVLSEEEPADREPVELPPTVIYTITEESAEAMEQMIKVKSYLQFILGENINRHDALYKEKTISELISALDSQIKSDKIIKSEYEQIQNLFGNGADDALWKPGCTLSEAVNQLIYEYRSKNLPVPVDTSVKGKLIRWIESW